MSANEELNIEQRRAKITELINSTGKVRVTELGSLFNSSEVTIRNDLKELEKIGVLERVHGGAVLTAYKYYNMNFMERQSKNVAEKKAIAAATIDLVKEGQTLMINSGTTTCFIASALKNKRGIKVLTNSIPVCLELAQIHDIDVILIGGHFDPVYSFSYGEDAISQISKYKADCLILSIDGISVQGGITTYHEQETEINKSMIERSKKTVVVADYTKIGCESFSHIAPISSVDAIVTNKRANIQELKELESHGVEIISV